MPPVPGSSGVTWLSTAAAAATIALAPAPARAANPCGAPTNVHQCSEEPPTASFRFAPNNPRRRDTVTFTGKAAANPDRTLKSTRWDLYYDGEFSDGTALTARRTFYRPGTYTIRLRVEDDHGAVTT